MKEVVEVLVSALVEHPEQVEVTESTRGGTVHIEVTVAPSDMGKVIGRHGRIAQAIRTLASTAAAKENRRAVVDFKS